MNKYLPSKRFFYTLLAVILAVLIVWGVDTLVKKQAQLEQTKNAEKVAAENKRIETFQQFMAIDSDKDGLKDWEEALWKTDPKNVDTDGDKTSDGEEVRVNRDPLKKGPGDETDPKVIAENKKVETEFAQLNATEKLSHTLFSQYIASKDKSPLSKTSKQIILDTAISMTSDMSTSTQYTLSNLKISTATGVSVLKEYGNKLTTGAQNNTGVTIQQELSVLATAISDNNEDELAKLDPAIKLYDNIINNYLNLAVPAEVAGLHLKIINDLIVIRDDVKKMKLIFSDTLQAILGINDYKISVTRLASSYSDLGKYFETKGVTFSPIDAGYKLFNVVK